MTERELGQIIDRLYKRLCMGVRLGVSAEAMKVLENAYDGVYGLWSSIYGARRKRQGW